jgi:Rod binding domain-containing protein
MLESGTSTAGSSLAFDGRGLESLKHQARASTKGTQQQVAQQFEALFLQMMIKRMREATPKDGLFDSDQSRMMQSLLDEHLATQLASPGIGLAQSLLAQMQRHNPEPALQTDNQADPDAAQAQAAQALGLSGASLMSADRIPGAPPPKTPLGLAALSQAMARHVPDHVRGAGTEWLAEARSAAALAADLDVYATRDVKGESLAGTALPLLQALHRTIHNMPESLRGAVVITSAFRDFNKQLSMWNTHREEVAAGVPRAQRTFRWGVEHPTTSWHSNGHAVDLGFRSKEAESAFHQQAARNGLYRPYGADDYVHWALRPEAGGPPGGPAVAAKQELIAAGVLAP